MKRQMLTLLVIIVSSLLLFSCSKAPSIDVDPVLLDYWVQLDSAGGSWAYTSGYYIGLHFVDGGRINAIGSTNKSSWEEEYTGVRLTLAESGIWESDAGGYGSYSVVGDTLTWTNLAGSGTSYFGRRSAGDPVVSMMPPPLLELGIEIPLEQIYRYVVND